MVAKKFEFVSWSRLVNPEFSSKYSVSPYPLCQRSSSMERRESKCKVMLLTNDPTWVKKRGLLRGGKAPLPPVRVFRGSWICIKYRVCRNKREMFYATAPSLLYKAVRGEWLMRLADLKIWVFAPCFEAEKARQILNLPQTGNSRVSEWPPISGKSWILGSQVDFETKFESGLF